MSHHPSDGVRQRPAPTSSANIFAWSGGGIVLLGERTDGRWVVARGWRRDDRLTDVRRWSFADPRAFAGQVRRLAREVASDPAASATAGAAALAWAQALDLPER